MTYIMFLAFSLANIVVVNSLITTSLEPAIKKSTSLKTSPHIVDFKKPRKILPINKGSVEHCNRANAIYVDKTEFAHQLIKNQERCSLFLRPRRFGKTFFLNTLRSILQGKRHEFQNTYIGNIGYDWEEHIVVQLSLEGTKPIESLFYELRKIAEYHGVKNHEDLANITANDASYFRNLMTLLAEKGKPVAVLIDEYDLPFRNPTEAITNYFSDIFFYLKKLTDKEIIRLAFITGCNKIELFADSTAMLRSGVPGTILNILDLSMNKNYASICGFTADEIKHNFHDYVLDKANRFDVRPEEIYDDMKHWYNGYSFTTSFIFTYNPISVLHYLDDVDARKARNYWVHMQKHPKTVLEALIKARVSNKSVILDLEKRYTQEDLFQYNHLQGDLEDDAKWDLTKQQFSLESILFQSGYLTIAQFNPYTCEYTLQIPNMEILEVFREAIEFSLKNDDNMAILHKRAMFSLQGLQIEEFLSVLKLLLREYTKFNLKLNTHAHEHLYQFVLQTLLIYDSASRKGSQSWRVTREQHTNKKLDASGRVYFLIETNNNLIMIKCKFKVTIKNFKKGWEQVENYKFPDSINRNNRGLVRMLLNFDEDRILSCQVATYDKKDNFIIEIYKKLEEPVFLCDECKKKFKYYFNLLVHIRDVHKYAAPPVSQAQLDAIKDDPDPGTT